MQLLKVDIEEAGYKEKETAIKDIRFSIAAATLTGMIGANGAGKSTTIKAIQEDLPYFKGLIERRGGIKSAYIPERPVYYEELTLWEHFEFVAAVEQLQDESLSYAFRLLKKFHLYDRRHEFPDNFSKGMQQKGMIALALFKKPDLLFIDEPFMGLDPASTKLLLHMLEEEKRRGTGILMCTHILDTAQRICDAFVVIEDGTAKAFGSLDEVLRQTGAEDGSLYSCIGEVAHDE